MGIEHVHGTPPLGGRAGRIPVSRETPLRAWLLGRSERQCSVPRGIRVQFLHELVAPIRHDLSTSPVRIHSTRKAREQRSARKASIFMPLGACKGITIPTEMPEQPVFMRGRVQAAPAWTI